MSQFQYYRRAMGEDDTYRSPEEEVLAQRLLLGRVKFTYEERKLRYTHTTKSTYKSDFEVATPIGPILVEVKGYWTHQHRQKIRQLLKQHPDLRLVMAFIKPSNKISAQSKTTYPQFCEKNGIPWIAYKDLLDATPACLPAVLMQAVEAIQSSSTSPAPDATALTLPLDTTTGTSSASPASPA